MPKSQQIPDSEERMRLYEIFVAAGVASKYRNIASVAALGGIAEDEPVIRTYRTVDLEFNPETQTMQRASGGCQTTSRADKKTLVIQL